MSQQAAKHHKKAAQHHSRAAEHHRRAASSFSAGKRKEGAYSAHNAHGHALHANDSANEASKYHARQDEDNENENYGRSGRYESDRDEERGYGKGPRAKSSRSPRDEDEDEDEDDMGRYASDMDEDEDDEDEDEDDGYKTQTGKRSAGSMGGSARFANSSSAKERGQSRGRGSSESRRVI